MNAIEYIDAQSLEYWYGSGKYVVTDKTTQGSGPDLDSALAAYMAGLVDARAALDAPLAAYSDVDNAAADVLKAYQDNEPMPVKVLPGPVDIGPVEDVKP